MTDLTKTTGLRQQNSSAGFGERTAIVAIVFLLLAVEGLFIVKHPNTLNIAAVQAAFGVNGPLADR